MIKKSIILLIAVFIAFSQIPDGARYLIICADDFEEDLQPLADWKTQKGYLSYIATLSETGTSGADIENYIKNAYETWDPAPEFVLLVGNNNIIPMRFGGRTEYGRFDSDWEYGEMTDDLFNDIQVGRFPARNNERLRPMIEKTLRYDIDPLSDDLDDHWLSKGITIIMEDGDDDDSLYWANTDTAALGMTRNGYTHIDRFSLYRGDDAEDVEAAVNDGRALILFRGQSTTNWWSPFDVDPWELDNGFMTPVVLSITCHTISDGRSSQAGTWWLESGYDDIDSEVSGAVGFVGTTNSISGGAHLRGEIAEGIVNSFYSDTTNDLGRAVEAGRLNQYLLYENEAQYTGHLLLGDPELDIRTKPPAIMSIDHYPALPVGATNADIGVNGIDGPLENALVCITDFENTHSWGYTDASGNISLPINVEEAGTLTVTISYKNYYPSVSQIVIVNSGTYVMLSGYSIDDAAGGNGDGYLNPGEEVEVAITLFNNGIDDATDVNAILRSSDPYVEIIDSVASYGSIAAHTDSISQIFTISVDSDCPKGHFADLSVFSTDGSGGEFTENNPDILVYQPNFVFHSYIIDDANPLGNGNSLLEPGETGMYMVAFQNTSPTSINSITMTFRPLETGLIVEDSIVNYSRILGASEFETPGRGIPITMYEGAIFDESETVLVEVTGEGGTYTYQDTILFDVITGGPGRIFTGPDEYGYYCYDDTDGLTGRAHEYSWFEISGIGSEIDGVTNRDDDIVSFDIPIELSYYGETYDRISVSTNGFITLGNETWSGGGRDGHERPIPTVGQASAIIAPLWCDLNPRGGGNVYGHYDESNNRIVMEFDEVEHYGLGSGTRQTFQVFITDPDHYSTPTGDSEIIFQYARYDEDDDVTHAVGIESPDERMGIQYEYHGEYAEGAQPITEERTIKFTTNPPITPDNRWLVISEDSFDDTELGNGDMQADYGETFDIMMTVKNSGTLDADDVEVTLRHGSDIVSFIDSSASFGDIAASTTGNNDTNPFRIAIDGDSGSDTIVYLFADIICNGGEYSRTTKLAIPIKATTEAMTYEINRGWNMISYPFDNTVSKEIIFPDAIDEIYTYNPEERVYEMSENLGPGPGYWVLYRSADIINRSDSPWLSEMEIILHPGWNLIGSIASSYDASIITSNPEVIGPVYIYDGSIYEEVEYLMPGNGYWVLATEELTITIE
ncbi:MAG: C25 family cysteine peptidase [Candidatus Zixiibacteriota bacterium]